MKKQILTNFGDPSMKSINLIAATLNLDNFTLSQSFTLPETSTCPFVSYLIDQSKENLGSIGSLALAVMKSAYAQKRLVFAITREKLRELAVSEGITFANEDYKKIIQLLLKSDFMAVKRKPKKKQTLALYEVKDESAKTAIGALSLLSADLQLRDCVNFIRRKSDKKSKAVKKDKETAYKADNAKQAFKDVE